METTYTMIGADGQQYGPINLAQIKTWISEGRITSDTQMLRSDTNAWLPASSYSELGLAVSPAPARFQAQGPAVAVASAPRPAVAAAPDPLLARRVRVAASWFFVIGALSVVNTIISMSHGGAFFLAGLGINLLVHNLVINIAIAGVFALFGLFARQGHAWSFVVGMILYGLDALIFLVATDWLPFAFHAYALYRIFMGLLAANELKAQTR